MPDTMMQAMEDSSPLFTEGNEDALRNPIFTVPVTLGKETQH